jgi:hypothetical protein
MVSVIAIVTKVRGSNPPEDDGFLRAIQIHSLPSFGEEVKPLGPCWDIGKHVKERFEIYKKYFVG